MTEANHEAMADYQQQLRDFNEKIEQLGLHDVKNFYWYHTIDLGNGLITPGSYDLRSSLGEYHFPENMTGMSVLDIGSATGFFAFEFERRGADVTSVDLPSLEELDRFPGQTADQSLEKIRRMLTTQNLKVEEDGRAYSAAQIYHLLLDGPFQFCRRMLGSRVQRRYSTIYDLSVRNLGRESFDLVFIGDVLLHTLYPLKALASAAQFCSGTLVVSQAIPETDSDQPVMVYVGGENPADDHVSWWLPNKACFVQMLKKLGFREVVDFGPHEVVLRAPGFVFDSHVLHAIR